MSEIVKTNIVLPEVKVAKKYVAKMLGTMVLALLGCGSAVFSVFSNSPIGLLA